VEGDGCPLPEDPTLRIVAQRLEQQRHIAEVWDADWRLAYLTGDYVLSAGAGAPLAQTGLGEVVFGEATITLREAWPAGSTTESFVDAVAELAPGIAHDLPGGADELRARAAPALGARLMDVQAAPPASLQLLRLDVKFGTATRPFNVAAARVLAPDGRFAGTALVVTPGLPGAVISLLGTGDHATLARMLELLRPARRPAAVMFVDLDGSAALAKQLPTPKLFALIRRLIFRIDEEVVSRRGVVGKHAGDGASAFFLAETFGGESPAARACIEAARAILGRTAEVAARSGLESHDVVVRFGLHWGASPYVGRLLTGGRTEVTALGEEVNETARIESCATGGLALASKALIERLDPADAAALELDPERLAYTPLTSLPSATEKARRDAPAIAVCEISGRVGAGDPAAPARRAYTLEEP
jgi:class 3 adenylate cyclase